MLDPRDRAKRLERPLAGFEEASVTHDVANASWRPDHLGVASGRLQNAEDPGVEDRYDLGQACGHCDFPDPQYEFAQDIVYPASASFWLAGDRGGANA